MVTNKEFVLNSINQVIKEYKIIIEKNLYSKRSRIANNVSIFSSKSILCQQNNSKKLCQTDKKGCYFYAGVTGCSRSNTFPLQIFRNDINYLQQRLEFWEQLKEQLIKMPTEIFLKKHRNHLHEITKKVDEKVFKTYFNITK